LVSDNLGVEPGDMYRIVENAEWLSYSLLEFSKLLKREDLLTSIYRTRLRIKYGIKEELLSLVGLQGIGRIRARAMYNAGLTDIRKVSEAPESKLSNIPKIGPVLAHKLKDNLNKRTIY